MEPPTFTYDPLPEGCIRLLTPVPSESDGHTWSLEVVSLDQPDFAYEALSYVWGAQAETYPIICNGRSLRAHHNLYYALPYLVWCGGCAREEVLPIWIDAVCINQIDQVEKMTQIRLMNQVYRNARKVWVWLGVAEHQERIPDAICVFKLISDEFYEKGEKLRDSDIADILEFIDLAPSDPTLRSAILHLINNDWFRRVWVVQEAALARNLEFICGDYGIVFHDIKTTAIHAASLFELIHFSRYDILPQAERLDAAVYHVQGHSTNNSTPVNMFAETLLHVSYMLTGEFECLQCEDRVFGILGMFEQEKLENTLLDLRLEFTSVQDLYVRFSTFILMHTDPTEDLWWRWLTLAFTLHKMTGLPSWVPDLHHQDEPHKPCPLVLYRAVTGKTNNPRCGSKPGQLVLRGRVFDEVDCVYSEMFDRNMYRKTSLVRLACSERPLAQACMDSMSEDEGVVGNMSVDETIPLEADFPTLFGGWPYSAVERLIRDRYHDVDTALQTIRDYAMQQDILHKLAGGLPYSDLGTTHADASTFRDAQLIDTDVEEKIEKVVFSRRHMQYFLSRDGRPGWTLKGVLPGDVVSALNGSPVLHVIRKLSDENDTETETWQFVGEAYVRGMMYGEVGGLHVEERDLVFV